jgi:hypothetical protein
MKTQAILQAIVVLSLLAGLSFCPSADAHAPLPPDADISSSASAGETRTYQASPYLPAQTVGTQDILLIQTSDPWERSSHYVGNNWYDGITSDTMVLDSLGYSYRIATWADINSGAVNIFGYPVVLIVNDQVQAFYDSYATHVVDFENYVLSGRTLVFFAAGYGWAGGQLRSPLPGGVVWNGNGKVAERNVVVNSNHPIATAELSDRTPLVGADLYSNYCSHGWFSAVPGGADIILRESAAEGGQPTFVEYALGAGRVIASTLTWEHSWSYHTGGDQYGTFARKALDDVFLYAFSSGATPAAVSLDLRVEDAPAWIAVNKSRGSYVDVVARVTGDAAYQAQVVLQVPGDKLGTPTKTFTRNRANNDGYGQENQYMNQGGGRYQINSDLQPLSGKFYKEIVWRFTVPAGATPEQDIQLSATVIVPGHTVQNPTDTVKLNIIDYARSLIVTNRKLLYNKFQPDANQDDVSPLLEEVYVQAWAYDGEVFYVELYNNQARDWSQNVDYSSENAANVVATAIDGLTGGWYNRLTKTPQQLVTLRPEYLLVVGGDEIIPFYRADDRPYGDDEHRYVHIDNADPVGRVPQEHYLLSDNIYADVAGSKAQWEEGKLELSVGRIIGHSAAAMRQFIENAWLETPALTQAVMASRSAAHNLDTARERLNSKHVTVYGESNPDLTENDAWTRAQWITALGQPFQTLAYQGHGAYDGWHGTDGWTSGVAASDQPAGQIDQNHPLFAVEACNFAIPTDLNGATWNPGEDDNISYKLISLGAGGILASMGIDTTAGGNRIAYGERLHNDYFRYLLSSSSSYSERFGTALLKAKQDYPGNGFPWGYNGTDKKTLMEYVYYGLPWSFMDTPDNQAIQAAQQVDGYGISSSAPEVGAAGPYSRDLTVTVTSYQFVPVDGFQLLDIPGADVLYELQKPVLPVIHTSVSLPPGASVTGLQLVTEHPVALGLHNIPAADPPNDYHPTTGYTSIMSVSGLYPPPPRYSYELIDLGDHTEVRIAVVPATFNVDTHAVILYDSTTLRLSYNASVPVAISAMSVDKPEYQVGDTVTPAAKVENVGASAVTLIPHVNVYDAGGAVVATTSGGSFTVPAGDSQLVQLPWSPALGPGGYQLAFWVESGGTPQASANASFNVLAGKIMSFDIPPMMGHGSYSTIGVSFANYRAQQVTANAKVYFYNSLGLDVASLLQRSFTIGADGIGSTSWSWDPAGLPTGEYAAQAVIQVGNETYLSPRIDTRITAAKRSIYLPLVRK